MRPAASTHDLLAVDDVEEDAALLDVFHHIAERWALSGEQRCKLLGIGRTTHYDWFVSGRLPRALSDVQREVIDHLLAIDLAIQTYVGRSDELPDALGRTATGERPLADQWVSLPGTAPNGEDRALDTILEGVTGLVWVRAALESRIGAPAITTILARGDLPEVSGKASVFTASAAAASALAAAAGRHAT